MYFMRQGVLQDNALAHMWYNICSASGNKICVKIRNFLEKNDKTTNSASTRDGKKMETRTLKWSGRSEEEILSKRNTKRLEGRWDTNNMKETMLMV
jgi:hypothetical protein